MSESTYLQLRSLITAGGELQLSLKQAPIPEPAADEVLIRIEAAPINPSDLALLIGPADLSFALGLPPRGDNPDPLHIATCDRIREAAHKAGIKCVMHCAAAPFAAGAVKRGFDMVMLTADLSCMIAGARQQLEELKAKSA